MGLMDEAKGKLGGAVDKAKDAAVEHADKIDEGIDKVADIVDKKTGQKHTEKIEKGRVKAKDLVSKLDKGGDDPGRSTGRPPTPDA